MRISLVLHPETAADLRRGTPALSSTRSLIAVADALGLALEPVHPGSDDDLLSMFFEAEVGDSAAAERALARLRVSEAVDTAYVKPPDALP